MRKFTLLVCVLVVGIIGAQAQTVATFDTLSLSGSDTFYVNYTDPGNDVGFEDGLVHFPCVYDTGFGISFLSYGFVYSNMTDSVTSGYTNQFSAKTAGGYNGSDQYIVASGSYNKVYMTGNAIGKPVYGFFVTNSTYAYNSMRDGDNFAKKFGGINGLDPDWFKLTIKGYLHDTLSQDSVDVMLADFTSSNSANDTILNGWKWVNLLSLGDVDSLEFTLTSSDNGQFGMNTPAYFCMDHFMVKDVVSVKNVPSQAVAKVYPNPAVNELKVQLNDENIRQLNVMDMSGRVIARYEVKDKLTSINTSSYLAGAYILQLVGTERNAVVRFVKQ